MRENFRCEIRREKVGYNGPFYTTYGVSSSALNKISSYLKHRTQRTKINDCSSARSSIKYGVPHGSILGPLLFNINMIDLFYECEEDDIANYADDTTPYSCGTDIPTVISKSQHYLALQKLY